MNLEALVGPRNMQFKANVQETLIICFCNGTNTLKDSTRRQQTKGIGILGVCNNCYERERGRKRRHWVPWRFFLGDKQSEKKMVKSWSSF